MSEETAGFWDSLPWWVHFCIGLGAQGPAIVLLRSPIHPSLTWIEHYMLNVGGLLLGSLGMLLMVVSMIVWLLGYGDVDV